MNCIKSFKHINYLPSTNQHPNNYLLYSLFRKLFGLEPVSCVEFNSYDDRNYFMVMQSKTSNPNITEINSPGYVLKVIEDIEFL